VNRDDAASPPEIPKTWEASERERAISDFKKAKKRVKSKPGHARDAFVEIAERLGRSVPHLLPSFWEEAGRAFSSGPKLRSTTTCA
jgi:hypothetical protein